ARPRATRMGDGVRRHRARTQGSAALVAHAGRADQPGNHPALRRHADPRRRYERRPDATGRAGAYLFDPNPAVTRAGLVAELASQLRAWQIDPMIAFLSSDEPTLTPFARTLRVVESAPWHEKRFAARLSELGIGAADIRRRGLAGDVDLI